MNTILSSLYLMLLLNNPSANTQALQNNFVKIQTVAIYSSDTSFFDDYPIDTLVSHLNYLNKNSRIVYCIHSFDSTKTGFNADFIIDLSLTYDQSDYVIPRVKETPVTRQIMRAIPEPGGTTRYEIAESIDHYETTVQHSTNSRYYYYLSMNFSRNMPFHESKKIRINSESGLKGKAKMIIKLIEKIQNLTSQ